MKKIALSTHLFPFHPLSYDTLNLVKMAGFDELEIWGMPPHFEYRDISFVKNLRGLLKKTWLDVTSVHLPFYRRVVKNPDERGKFYISDSREEERKYAVKEVIKCIEAAEYLGAEVCVLHTGMEFYLSSSDSLRRSIEEILNVAEHKGIKIAVENGFRPRTYIEDVLAVMMEFNSTCIGLCIDVGHLNIEGAWEKIKTLPSEKIFELHIVDNDKKKDQHLPPFEGTVPWEIVYSIMRNSKAHSVIETGPVYEDAELLRSILISGKRAGMLSAGIRFADEEYERLKRRSELLLFESKKRLMTKFFPMKGDASIRSYFRIYDDCEHSYVVMRIPLEAKEEEKVNTQQPLYMFDSFKSVYTYLRENKVPVPEVFFEDRGFFLVEDEGEWLLEDFYLMKKDDLLRLYEEAVSLLLQIQRLNKKGECIAHQRFFGLKIFKWEVEHFFEYGILHPELDVPEEVKEELFVLSENLSRMKKVFCHRDYHSKNLIVSKGGLKIVDFQDSLMGPPHYDLASLLYDSYTELDEETIERLKKVYYRGAVKEGIITESMDEFEVNLIRNALHRNLKAFGRFVFIYREKGNPYHIRYLLPTLRKAIQNARKLNFPATHRLLERILEYLEENGFPY